MSEQKLDSKVAIVYSQHNCAACNIAKTLLAVNGYRVLERSITEYRDEFIKDFPGKKSVPQIIINSIPIGNLSDLNIYLASNKL